jgi:hypothetical protein
VPDFCAPARTNSSRSIFLGLPLHIVMNQEPLTPLRNRSPRKMAALILSIFFVTPKFGSLS